MKPKKNAEINIFKTLLTDIIDINHPLVLLANTIYWKSLDDTYGEMYCENNGRPGKPTRLMVGLHYLKYLNDLSDEEVVVKWVENPYWQYFCGELYFQHKLPIDPTSMTKWRNRIKSTGLEKMLELTIQTGFKEGIISKKSIERVNVDTTVQEKNITFPTDAKLYYKMILKLVRLAKANKIDLKQTYVRVGKKILYQMNRHVYRGKNKNILKCKKSLKTKLGRLFRDIERKADKDFKNSFIYFKHKELYERLMNQKKDSKNKIYSIHAPEAECISKGKSHKKYEFGNKVGIVSSSKDNFILGCLGFHGNPFDGHTLQRCLDQAAKNVESLGEIKEAYTDRGYKGNNYIGNIMINITKNKTKNENKTLRKWMNRRSAIEPDIGHLKNEHRLGRNYLAGKEGDRINAILSACGFNLRKLLKAFFGLIFILVFRLKNILNFAFFENYRNLKYVFS
jgi:IS5 family transposase